MKSIYLYIVVSVLVCLLVSLASYKAGERAGRHYRDTVGRVPPVHMPCTLLDPEHKRVQNNF